MNSIKNIPEFLKASLEEQYGKEKAEEITMGYWAKRPVTLRINTIKSSSEEIKRKLERADIASKSVPWNENALILPQTEEEEIRKLEIYLDGKIYLQSLSSMIPPIVLEPKQGESILDMAAAPGGKTTQIAAITDNKATITACEMNAIRAERLKYNLEKQGANSTYVMVTDARRLDDFFSFDRILLDAPCSGSGTIDSKTDFSKTFTQKLIQKSVGNQIALLTKALKLLKPGSEMVYSTCSILSEENECVVKKVLQSAKAQIVPINLKKLNGIPMLKTKLEGTLCVCPNEFYEGFFVAKIRKEK